MQSMTGYGKAEYSQGGITLTVEIKTVNNRFLDLIPKYPRCFVSLDDMIRKTVQSKLKRGRVELFVTYVNTNDTGKTIVLDEGLAKQYVDAHAVLKKTFKNLDDDFMLTNLMRMPDVLTEQINETAQEFLQDVLSSTLISALDNLNSMRKTEGEKLKADLLKRNNTIEDLVLKISDRAPCIKEEYSLKIKARMQEILGDLKYDEGRMLQEVALFADKSNIDEELTRLKSHVEQLRSICKDEEDAGKKLDFLMQEFNRETNTICSKSNDLEITRLGLLLKNEIEKMREQVQNIE